MTKLLSVLCDVAAQRDEERWAFQICARMLGVCFLLSMAEGSVALQVAAATMLAILVAVGRQLSLREKERHRQQLQQKVALTKC